MTINIKTKTTPGCQQRAFLAVWKVTEVTSICVNVQQNHVPMTWNQADMILGENSLCHIFMFCDNIATKQKCRQLIQRAAAGTWGHRSINAPHCCVWHEEASTTDCLRSSQASPGRCLRLRSPTTNRFWQVDGSSWNIKLEASPADVNGGRRVAITSRHNSRKHDGCQKYRSWNLKNNSFIHFHTVSISQPTFEMRFLVHTFYCLHQIALFYLYNMYLLTYNVWQS